MLSKAAKYAIRSTLHLANNSSALNKINIMTLAKEVNVPAPFVAKLLQQLAKANIVSSTKGPTGGFYLSEVNMKKSLWDVIITIDGEDKFQECFLGLPECNAANPCEFHDTAAKYRHELIADFKSKSFSSIMDKKDLNV
jgi:Rrf2 family protein